MPNNELCEIAIILDRSGSMASIKEDMEGGFKTFMEEQRLVPSPCVVSLYQFDNDMNVVFEERPLADVADLVLAPRGGTALYDAMGQVIVMMGERLAKKPEQERPGKVVVLVITDGQENASKEYAAASVKNMVTEQREKYNWQFAFLGANIDSFDVGGHLGVAATSTANYEANARGVRQGYQVSGQAVRSYRSGRGASGQSVHGVDFTSEEEKKP